MRGRGTVAFLTGALSGIGEAPARLLARRGYATDPSTNTQNQ
jgi:NADP-dependent 3-hydroxy acid dehydrogenase YdfG